jgi:hypothetical protein
MIVDKMPFDSLRSLRTFDTAQAGPERSRMETTGFEPATPSLQS